VYHLVLSHRWVSPYHKLLQRHVKGTLPVLKETVLALARSQRFSEEFTRSQLFPLGGFQSYDGKYDYDEQDFDPPSLDKRWRRFHAEKLICWVFGEFRIMHFHWAVAFCLCVACFSLVAGNILTQSRQRTSIYVLVETRLGFVPCAFLFTCSFNCLYTSIAYTCKFLKIEKTYKGIEWVEVSPPFPLINTRMTPNNRQSLSPKPSVGVWWEVELIAMPAVWTRW
jgi:hypothetical protein